MQYKSRYPGVKPFETEDQQIFFGRSADIKQLYDLVRVEKTVLLYSKSGLGKTSLINAGLVPRLISGGNYNYFTVRLGAFSDNNSLSPREKVIDLLRKDAAGSPLLVHPELTENALGFWMKAIQVKDSLKTNVLIFDQFEELFTFPEDQVEELKKELYELIHLKTSSSFRDKILHLIAKNPDAVTEEQFNTLSSAVNIRMLFAIRSDFLSLLNRLTDYLPNLQRTFYELKPLDIKEARNAILGPAQSDSDFSSPKFDFVEETVNKILDALSDHHRQPIETFQLQIVCQYAENIVLKDPRHLTIVPDDLGDIKDIHQSFYDNLIAGLPAESEEEKLRLRILLEEQFIYEPEKRRLQVLKGILLKRISETTLKALEKTHLVRSEPYQDSFTYELSHDTLVEPILKSYQLRKENEEKKEAESRREEELRSIHEKARRQRVIISIVSFAAAISITFAVIGFSMYRKAETEKDNAQKAKIMAERMSETLKREQEESRRVKYRQYFNDANNFKDDAKYSEAIQSYKTAKDFTNDTLPVLDSIKKCKIKAELAEKFANLMQEGKDLQNDENTLADAMIKYREALKLGYDNKTVSLQIKELNSNIEIAVRSLKDRANGFIQANGCEDARPLLRNALRMKPDDPEIRKLLEKCK